MTTGLRLPPTSSNYQRLVGAVLGVPPSSVRNTPRRALLRRYDSGGVVPPEERAAFVQRLLPYAERWSAQTGIAPEVYLAMLASESNFGRAPTYFGIKGPSPSGNTQTYQTWEQGPNGERVVINDQFATYADPDEGHQHFVQLVSSGQYAPAWQSLQQHRDGYQFLRDITAGLPEGQRYATNTDYANYIRELAQSGVEPYLPEEYRRRGAGGAAAGAAGAAQAGAASSAAGAVGGAGYPTPAPRPYAQGGRVPLSASIPRYQVGGQSGEDARRAQFVRTYLPYAKRWAAETGIPALVFLGIGASESNFGATGTIFGIKGKGTAGSRTYDTWEMINGRRVDIKDEFALYNNPDEAFQAFMSHIQGPQFLPAWQQFQRDKDPYGLLVNLQRRNYATDTEWPRKVFSLASTLEGIAKANGIPLDTATAPTTTPESGNGRSNGANTDATPQGATNNTGRQGAPAAGQPAILGDPTLHAEVQARQQDLTTARQIAARVETERQQLQAKPNRTRDEETRLLNIQSSDLPEARRSLDNAASNYDSAMKLYLGTIPKAAGGSGADDTAARAQLLGAQTGAARLEFDRDKENVSNALTMAVRMYEAARDGVKFAFERDKGTAELVLGVIDANIKNSISYYTNLLNQGRITIDGFAAVITAQAAQQTAVVAKAAHDAQVAGFIAEEHRKNAERILPQGTRHQPGFAPDSPLNVALQQAGLGQLVMPVREVDLSKLDPVENLRLARVNSAVPDPNFNIDQLRAEVQRVKDITIPRPDQIVFGGVNDPSRNMVKLPDAADLPTLMEYLGVINNPEFAGFQITAPPAAPGEPGAEQPATAPPPEVIPAPVVPTGQDAPSLTNPTPSLPAVPAIAPGTASYPGPVTREMPPPGLQAGTGSYPRSSQPSPVPGTSRLPAAVPAGVPGAFPAEGEPWATPRPAPVPPAPVPGPPPPLGPRLGAPVRAALPPGWRWDDEQAA